jgi:DNA primase
MSKGFVSFAEVKRAVSMEAVLSRYGLLADLVKKGRNLAGPCPFCNGTSARQFQVNLEKNAWYCFGCKQGGNVLDFVATREAVSARAAALKLDAWFELGLAGKEPGGATSDAPAEEAPAKELPTSNPPLTFTLKTLDPQHPNLAPLGIEAETLTSFGAGYCTKGFLKGRLAIPVKNREGELVAYAGLATEGEEPRYLFPPNFHPSLEVMNLDRLAEFAGEAGPLYLAPEIEGVLRLAEAGCLAVLGLFDGTLSEIQEDAIGGALALFERIVLVGDGFADRTVARLARYAAVSWIAAHPEESEEEPEEESGEGEEEA